MISFSLDVSGSLIFFIMVIQFELYLFPLNYKRTLDPKKKKNCDKVFWVKGMSVIEIGLKKNKLSIYFWCVQSLDSSQCIIIYK